MKNNTYFVVPSDIALDRSIKPIAKLLFGHISALTTKYGYCYATNKYFADIWECSERAIRDYIKILADHGYIRVEMVEGYKRKIYLTETTKVVQAKVAAANSENTDGWNEQVRGGGENSPVYNNNIYNNLLNNKTEYYSVGAERLENLSTPLAELPSLTLNDKSSYSITQDDLTYYKELYPNVDVEQEIRNMAGWLYSNPQKRKTKKGIKRFITSWLSRASTPNGFTAKGNKVEPIGMDYTKIAELLGEEE